MPPRNFRIPIQEEKFYHIWNRGNNRENLFYNNGNYEYFLRLYAEKLDDVLETYAFCLLPNHFHLLVRTKLFRYHSQTAANMNPVSNAFKNFFAAYSQAINIQQKRTGSLFQKPFKRLEVKTTKQLANLVHYIHINPQKHGICGDFRYYPWSSYERMLKNKPSKLKKEEVVTWFGHSDNYLRYHARDVDLDVIKYLIIE
ncbi:transposase [Saccharicrinis sp. 156]|uniref:transposase n=1 Tax=Saccharicrinis sp. 156 TaxID=3417574 RepID=UPI003D3255A8